MQLTQAAPVSAARLWAGRIISALMVLFLVFDGVTKLMKVPQVLEAQARLGYPANHAFGIGITVLACTLVYVIPRTSILGAILLTGYLGGAVASQVRIGAPLFDTVFPIVFGVLIWVGLYLRDRRLRPIIFPEPARENN
jgi:hypothetical protein